MGRSARRYLARFTFVSIVVALVGLALPQVAHAVDTVRINGTVTNQTGGGVLNVSVTATAPGGSTVLFGPVLTAANGSYELTVDPGTYDIHFVPPSGSGLSPITANSLNAATNQVLNVQLTSPTHTLSGTLRNGGGQALPSMQITLRHVTSQAGITMTTDANGRYNAAVNSGAYYLQRINGTAPAPLGNIDLWHWYGTNDSRTVQLDLTSNDLTRDLVLPTAALNVTVKDGFGNPVAGASVSVRGDSTPSVFPVTSGASPGYYHANTLNGTTNSSGLATMPAFQVTYPAGKICATVSGNQVCNTTSVTVDGSANLLFQAAPQAPPAPTGLSATSPTRFAPSLTWNPVSVAASYRVYRNGTPVGTTTSTSFVDSALSVSGTYTYTVTAVSQLNVESSGSSPVTVVYNADGPIVTNASVYPSTVAVGQPATLTATASDPDGVVAAEYFEGTDPGEGQGVAMSVSGSTLTATLPSTLSLGTHTFTVRAKNSFGNWTKAGLPTAQLTVRLPRLNGRVVSGANQGIASVRVDVVTPNDHSNVVATTTSDANGNYAASVTPGTYDVIFTPPGDLYQPTTKTGINLTTDATLDVALVLAPRTFQGALKDENNVAIPGASIILRNQGGQTVTATSGANGGFEAEVNPATYSLTIVGTKAAAPSAFIPTSFSLNGGAFDLTSHIEGVTLMVRAATVTFHTTSALTGADITGVALSISTSTTTTIYTGSGNYTGSATYNATTNPSGLTSVVMLEGSRYSVTATPPPRSGVVATSFPEAGPITEDPPLVELALNADIKHFDGRFTDETQAGIPGATVRLTGPLGTFQATTDANGDFDVEAAAGTYTLSVTGSKPGGSTLRIPDSYGFSGGTIDISTTGKTQDLRLDAAVVTVTALSPFDTPLKNVTITLASAPGSAPLYAGGSFAATAASTGTTGDPGTVTLYVTRGLGYTTKATPAAGSGYLVTNLPASPPVGDIAEWSIKLNRDLKRFTGVVRDKNGAVVTNATVRVDGNEQDQHYSTTTNGQGEFELQVAPNTSYSLRVSGTQATSPNAFLPDNFTLSATTNITTDKVQNVTVDAVTLDILARDDRLAPIRDVGIAFSSSGSQNGFAASSANINRTTGENGRTELRMLKGTTYTISATPPAGMGYLNTTFNGTSPILQDTESIIEFQNHIPLAVPDCNANSPTKTSPVIGWDPVASADHYKIYRDATHIGTTTTTSFTDSALAVDGTYQYRVSAVSTQGYEGPKCSPAAPAVYDTTAPHVDPPTFSVNPKKVPQSSVLRATVSDAGSGPSDGEYYIGSVDPGEGNGTPMAYANGVITATIGTNLHPGTYRFYVRDKDVLGTWSQPQPVDLIVGRPVPPSNLAAASPTNLDPALSWTASPDAVAYHVYRDDVRLPGAATGTTYTDTNRPDGRYDYTVRAVNELGDESDDSNAVTVHIDKTRPTIDHQRGPDANGAGWSNSPVTVTFACVDESGGSGIQFCTPPQTVSADTSGQDVPGLAVDVAGNTASTTVTVKLDRTAPTHGTPLWNANPKAVGGSTALTVPTSDALSGVVGGEYYVDSDPGVGLGTAMTNGGGNLTATIGAGLAIGVYRIGIRGKDAAGNWSAPVMTMLVVYDPAIPVGVTGKNKNDLVPSLANGDVLPGLTAAGQTDTADYGFTVDYTGGALDPKNDFMFAYSTGAQCNTPHPQNCHSITVSAISFEWMIIDQANNSRGRFQGTATVTIDGVTTTNPFTVEGIDGDRLTPAGNDRFLLRIYAPGASPDASNPIYQASGSLPKGNSIKVR
jgi:fibronectin type 3 domain-containing protein